jgi:hypothetical protein
VGCGCDAIRAFGENVLNAPNFRDDCRSRLYQWVFCLIWHRVLSGNVSRAIIVNYYLFSNINDEKCKMSLVVPSPRFSSFLPGLVRERYSIQGHRVPQLIWGRDTLIANAPTSSKHDTWLPCACCWRWLWPLHSMAGAACCRFKRTSFPPKGPARLGSHKPIEPHEEVAARPHRPSARAASPGREGTNIIGKNGTTREQRPRVSWQPRVLACTIVSIHCQCICCIVTSNYMFDV